MNFTRNWPTDTNEWWKYEWNIQWDTEKRKKQKGETKWKPTHVTHVARMSLNANAARCKVSTAAMILNSASPLRPWAREHRLRMQCLHQVLQRRRFFFWRMRYRVPWNHSCKQLMIVNSHWFVSSMHAVSSLSKFGSISLLDVTANPSIIEKNVERNSLCLQKLSALIGSLPCKTFCYLGDRHYSACQARDSKLRH